MEQEIQEEPWLQCSSCHDSRFAPKPCISIISLVSVEKPNNTEGHQPFPFSPPSPVHPGGSCFTSQQAVNLGSRNRRAASSESLLWTCSMLCRVPSQEAKPLHHLPLSCPCTSQFMFQENREKDAAVTTKLLLVQYYGNVIYGQKRSSSPTFYLIQASEFHFAVPGISHGTAGPARLKAGA